jgi:cyclopropane fatty-acyl-phospholipid synthase-like methyltransferase
MWEERFQTKDYVFGTAPSQFVTRRSPAFPAGAKLLSIAEGEGRNGVWLAQQGFDVTGVEFAPSAVAKAQKLAAERGVSPTFEQADLFEWDWPKNAFDVVMGVFFQFMGAAQRATLFGLMSQALRPGGLLALHGYTPKQLEYGTGGPKQLENLYTANLLSEAFPDFEILTNEEYEAELNEGAGHAGTSALIDFIARKP